MMSIASIPVLAIDGPGGTGKGTVSARIARQLGWNILDSGALYRAFAFVAKERNIQPDDVDGIKSIDPKNEFLLELPSRGDMRISVSDRDISGLIRSEYAGKLASVYAAAPAVRDALIKHQREFRKPPGLVADGRDMGTVVFPDALLKVFLDASAKVRAERRYNQLKSKDFNVNLLSLEQQIAERDRRDTHRTIAPLVPAHDAVVIDTSRMTIEEVVEEVGYVLNLRLCDVGRSELSSCQ